MLVLDVYAPYKLVCNQVCCLSMVMPCILQHCWLPTDALTDTWIEHHADHYTQIYYTGLADVY